MPRVLTRITLAWVLCGSYSRTTGEGREHFFGVSFCTTDASALLSLILLKPILKLALDC